MLTFLYITHQLNNIHILES